MPIGSVMFETTQTTRGVVAAQEDVGENASDDADAETNQDAGVQGEALGTIRGLVVEVGGGFALEVVGRAGLVCEDRP